MKRRQLLVTHSWVEFIINDNGSRYSWVGRPVGVRGWQIEFDGCMSGLGFWLNIGDLLLDKAASPEYIGRKSNIRYGMKS